MKGSEGKLKLLMEEWKANVSLYIDQDKRGTGRIGMFLVLNGGLFVLYANVHNSNSFVQLLIAVIAIVLAILTYRMSNRAHAFIHLRTLQAALIEKRIKLLLKNSHNELEIDESIAPSTFSRELTAFKALENDSKFSSEMQELEDEFGGKAVEPFKKGWYKSIRHLTWLRSIFWILGLFWFIMAVFSLLRIINALSAAMNVPLSSQHGKMADFGLSYYLKFDWPLDLVSILAGGIVGFLLVFIIDFIKKPRLKVLGFERASVNFGTLYKLRFKIKGRSSPGVCRLRISWSDRNVYAKWDETPNPLDDDNLSKFKPELVPGTFDQPLFKGIEYSVPIVIENNGNREVFSGWWFGKNIGYGPNPRLEKGFNTKLTLYGTGLSWTRSFTEKEICKS